MKKEFQKRSISSLVLISLIILIISQGSILLNLFILICFLISLYEWHRMRENNIYYIIGIIFLSLSFFSVYRLINYSVDYTYFLFILLICISTDL